jgi:hypothetical protein
VASSIAKMGNDCIFFVWLHSKASSMKNQRLTLRKCRTKQTDRQREQNRDPFPFLRIPNCP